MDLVVPAEQPGEKRKRDVNASLFGYAGELQCYANQPLRPALVISGRLAEDRTEEMKQHCAALWNTWKEFETNDHPRKQQPAIVKVLSESQAAARDFVFAQITSIMQFLFQNSIQARVRSSMLVQLKASEIWKCGTFCTLWETTILPLVGEVKAATAAARCIQIVSHTT